MRKRGLVFLLVLSGIIALFLLLFSDRLIEWGMEKAGSSIVGAKVEFDNVDFRLFSLSMSWNRLQVTNPSSTWRNLIETGFVQFDMALEPLLMNRFVVQNMQTDSLRFNTKRESNGALAGNAASDYGPVGRVQELITEELVNLPAYQIADLDELKVDSIIRILSLHTPSVIDSLEENVDSTIQYWSSRVKKLPSEQEIKALRRKIETIQPDETDSPQEVREAIAAAQEIRNTLDSLMNTINQLDRQFKTDIRKTGKYDENVSSAVSGDVQRAAELADIPKISTAEITRAIFGPSVANTLLGVLHIIGTARYYSDIMKDDQPEKREDPPRLSGQTIRYRGMRDWPKIWVQNMSLSAVIAGIYGKGTLQHISSYQALIGKPILLELFGTDENGGSIKLDGIFDYIGEIPKDSLLVSVAGIPLKGFNFASSQFLPLEIESGRGSISGALSFIGERFLLESRIKGEEISYNEQDTEKDNDELKDLQQRVARSLSSFSVEVFSKYIEDSFSLDLRSDIGKLIAEATQQMLGDQVDSVTQEIRSRIEKDVSGNLKTLQSKMSKLNRTQETFEEKRRRLGDSEELVRSKIDALKKETGKKIFEKIQ